MTIREAIDAIVTQSCCHSERPLRSVAIGRIFAKPVLSDAEGESWAGKPPARRTEDGP